MAKHRQSVLTGVLWVVAVCWLASEARAQDVATPAGQQELATYVTFRVETADGKWMRFTTREHQTAVFELLSTGERFGLTPVRGSTPDEFDIAVVRLDLEKDESDRSLERLTAKLGFPAFLADPALLRLDVEAVETREVRSPQALTVARVLMTKGPTPESVQGGLQFESQCCLTCDGVAGCGCFVIGSCGSCCDCCGPLPK